MINDKENLNCLSYLRKLLKQQANIKTICSSSFGDFAAQVNHQARGLDPTSRVSDHLLEKISFLKQKSSVILPECYLKFNWPWGRFQPIVSEFTSLLLAELKLEDFVEYKTRVSTSALRLQLALSGRDVCRIN